MAYEVKRIAFSESEVSTLAELAESLAPRYGWQKWRAEGGNIVFEAKDSDGSLREGYVGPSGFAYRMEDDEEDWFSGDDEWPEYDVNWDEDFDGWNNHVWGEDENGDTVMVHD